MTPSTSVVDDEDGVFLGGRDLGKRHSSTFWFTESYRNDSSPWRKVYLRELGRRLFFSGQKQGRHGDADYGVGACCILPNLLENYRRLEKTLSDQALPASASSCTHKSSSMALSKKKRRLAVPCPGWVLGGGSFDESQRCECRRFGRPDVGMDEEVIQLDGHDEALIVSPFFVAIAPKTG